MFGFKDSIDKTTDSIKKEIEEWEPKILKWLEDHGYTLIGQDKRVFFYSYRVIKGNKLETKKEFSFSEMQIICDIK